MYVYVNIKLSFVSFVCLFVLNKLGYCRADFKITCANVNLTLSPIDIGYPCFYPSVL